MSSTASQTQTRHAVLLGASKGIGYHVLLRLLKPSSGWTATVLLRKPDVFKDDPRMKDALADARLTILQGDATKEEDVKRLFGKHKDVDVVITSVGGSPKISLGGIGLDQPNICSDCTVALLHTLQSLKQPKLPRVIAVSSMGMGENHHVMPLALRILYPWLLSKPHLDKEALEYLLLRSSSVISTPTTHIPTEANLRSELIPTIQEGFLPEVIIVRPALLTGDGSAEEVNKIKGKEKTKVGEEVYTYTVNRAEVGRFIVDECLPGVKPDVWVNRIPVVGW